MVARSVAEMYAKRPLSSQETSRLLDTSLNPRGPELLFDLAQQVGLETTSTVLDVGCRDGTQLIELHRRTGCAGVGLDPVADNLDRAPADIAAAPIHLVRGVAQALPFTDSSFDLVWEEHGDHGTSRQLLWAARLLREPDHYKAKLGEAAYAGELANCLWSIYQMIGKLSPVAYVLRNATPS